MKLGVEDVEQIKLFDWIRSRPDIEPFSFHCANERKCPPIQGTILKRKGVRAGVSDVFIGISRGGYHGAFIELKAGKNKPTESQLKFMGNMRSQGYYCEWCVGYEAARNLIEDYLSLEKPSY